MSEVKVNKISPRTNCGTVQLGDSGDTITIPAGATITNNGTQTGFGRTGAVDWQTGSIKTTTFTAVSGEGYFVDTSSGAVTVNLPAGTAGAIVAFADYTRTFQNNALTISPNGSNKIGGVAENATLSTEGEAATFVFVDATEGWINVQNADQTKTGVVPYVAATGGTESTCGDFKIHTFTGPGTFTVTEAGSPLGNDQLEYIVVAGGGGGGGCAGNLKGGSGAGGFRFASPSLAPLTYPGKPLAAPAGLTAAAQAYPITIGAGGAGNPGGGPSSGNNGNPSTFSTITSTGGGTSCGTGGSGGGGAGGTYNRAGGAGNTPPTSPSQGNNGGTSATSTPQPDHASGGGGGAIAVGTNGHSSPPTGSGSGGDGAGIPTAFGSNGVPCGSFRYYAGGGGGGANPPVSTPAGSGGKGGGSQGATGAAPNATANTGGGGGAGGSAGPSPGGNGGSGIVIIRYKFQN